MSAAIIGAESIDAFPKVTKNDGELIEGGATIVVTSINRPTKCLIAFAQGAAEHGARLIVAGDRKSPLDFDLPGTDFISLDEQGKRFPKFAKLVPLNSYTRKNIGYLAAMKSGSGLIIDTDDDNAPLPGFWDRSSRAVTGRQVQRNGWVNAYAYFSNTLIWPRGLPLNEATSPDSRPGAGPTGRYDCPVQQGLADDNPDVDAIYRLLLPLPVKFDVVENIVLAAHTWCPFNSQNTKWWPEVFPLLYLPAYCSFRMTDIWRSFVVQRILWENGWHVSFHSSSVYQQRNEHNLMRDFEDEISGYLRNGDIREVLSALDLRSGVQSHGDNLRKCYGALVKMGAIGESELPLLDAWITETESVSKIAAGKSRMVDGASKR